MGNSSRNELMRHLTKVGFIQSESTDTHELRSVLLQMNLYCQIDTFPVCNTWMAKESLSPGWKRLENVFLAVFMTLPNSQGIQVSGGSEIRSEISKNTM